MNQGMGTSLSYTSHLSDQVARQAAAGFHVIARMPYRRFYECDQGWDQLMLPYVKESTPATLPRKQQGASASAKPSGQVEPAEDFESFGYFDPSDSPPDLPRVDSGWQCYVGIPADNKRAARALVADVVTTQIQSLKLHDPTIDSEMRRRASMAKRKLKKESPRR